MWPGKPDPEYATESSPGITKTKKTRAQYSGNAKSKDSSGDDEHDGALSPPWRGRGRLLYRPQPRSPPPLRRSPSVAAVAPGRRMRLEQPRSPPPLTPSPLVAAVAPGRRMRLEQPTKKKANCEIPQKLSINENVQATIAHVNNPNDFYIIKRDDLDTLNQIKLGLASMMPYGGLEIFQKQFSKMDVGVIKFSSKDFRRVKILKEYEDNKSRDVLYIDHGNKEKCDFREIKVMAGGYQNFHPMAIHCSLDVLPPLNEDGQETDEWNSEVIRVLKEDIDHKNKSATEQLDGGGLYARCIRKEGDLNIVKLKPLIGSDWGSLLVEQGFARKMEFPAKPKYDSEDEFDGKPKIGATTDDDDSSLEADDEGDGY